MPLNRQGWSRSKELSKSEKDQQGGPWTTSKGEKISLIIVHSKNIRGEKGREGGA